MHVFLLNIWKSIGVVTRSLTHSLSDTETGSNTTWEAKLALRQGQALSTCVSPGTVKYDPESCHPCHSCHPDTLPSSHSVIMCVSPGTVEYDPELDVPVILYTGVYLKANPEAVAVHGLPAPKYDPGTRFVEKQLAAVPADPGRDHHLARTTSCHNMFCCQQVVSCVANFDINLRCMDRWLRKSLLVMDCDHSYARPDMTAHGPYRRCMTCFHQLGCTW